VSKSIEFYIYLDLCNKFQKSGFFSEKPSKFKKYFLLNVQAQCNCTILTLLEVSRELSDTCSAFSMDSLMCVAKNFSAETREAMYEAVTTNCSHCGPMCSETVYKSSLSAAEWPSSYHWFEVALDNNITYQGIRFTEDMANAILK